MHPYSRQTINQLLAEMDGSVFYFSLNRFKVSLCEQCLTFYFYVLGVFRFKPNEGVIVVGATNFAEALDKYAHNLILFLFVCFTKALIFK